MAKVRIETVEDLRFRPITKQTRIFLDDVELQQVTGIKASWPVDAVCQVTVAMLPTELFEFVGDASVIVNVTVPPGFTLAIEEDGARTIYRAVPDVPAD